MSQSSGVRRQRNGAELKSQLLQRGLLTSGKVDDLRLRINAALSTEDGRASSESAKLALSMSNLTLLNKGETKTLKTLLKQNASFRSKMPGLLAKRTKKQTLFNSLSGKLFRSLHGSYTRSCSGSPVEYDSDESCLTVTTQVLGKRRTIVYENVDLSETLGDFEMTWTLGDKDLIKMDTNVTPSGFVLSKIASFFYIDNGNYYRGDESGLRDDVFSLVHGFGRQEMSKMSVGDIGMFLVFCVHCYCWRSEEIGDYASTHGSSITLLDAWSSLRLGESHVDSSALFSSTRLARHAHGFYARYGFVASQKPKGLSLSGFDLSDSSRNVNLHKNFCVDDIFAFFGSSSGSLKAINSFHDLTTQRGRGFYNLAADTLYDYLKYDRDINSGLWTPLMVSAKTDDLETCKRSVDLGADIEQRGDRSMTALMLASGLGHVNIVEYLITKKCDVNAATDKGVTALHYAAWKGQIECAKKLIDGGAFVDAVNNNNRTPYDFAITKGYADDFSFMKPSE